MPVLAFHGKGQLAKLGCLGSWNTGARLHVKGGHVRGVSRFCVLDLWISVALKAATPEAQESTTIYQNDLW